MISSAPPIALARLTAWRRLNIPGGELKASLVVLTAKGPVWNAPISRFAVSTRKPRWSTVIGVFLPGILAAVPWPMAGLPEASANVWLAAVIAEPR